MNAEPHLARYMSDVRKFPVLSVHTERELIRRWQEEEDPTALESLVGSYQRLVVRIATDYRRYGLALSDLISEGNIGLLQAIDKFDAARGFRLSTYAMWWIRASVTDYVMRSSSLVRVVTNENRRKLFFNLRRLRERHQPANDELLTPEALGAIARELRVPETEVSLMDRYFSGRDQSVNGPVLQDSDTTMTWQDLIVDDADDQETQVMDAEERDRRREMIGEALARLDDRERHILSARRLKDRPSRLAELGQHYGVSRERIRQIEARAMKKFAATIHRMVEAGGPERQESGHLPA